MARWEDLDAAFALPEWVSDEWRQLFEVLVARVRQETEHLPLNTLVQLQIERNLTTYIKIRQAESVAIGQPGGFSSVENARDEGKYWLSLTNALNDQVFKMKAADKKRVREELLGELKPVLAEYIKGMPVPDEVRATERTRLVGLLERAGL